jgi:hypothetical protein
MYRTGQGERESLGKWTRQKGSRGQGQRQKQERTRGSENTINTELDTKWIAV